MNWKVWFHTNKWLLLCVFVAFCFRLPLLSGSFWLDEAAQALESARPFNQQLEIAGDFQPPLLHYVVHFALYFSRGEWWLRTWGALIPGLVTVAATYWLGKKWFSEKAGILAATLLASNSFHIFYSQELRQYSLPTMWAVLGWISITHLIKHKNNTDNKNTSPELKHWAFWIGISLAGWYSSYLYPFVWVTQWLALFFFRRNARKTLFLASAFVLLGFAPWVPSLAEQLQVGGEVQASLPGWSSVVGTPWLKSLPLTLAKLLFGVLDISFNAYYFTTAFVIGGGLLWLLKSNFNILFDFKKPFNLLPLVWLFLPLLLTWIVSLWIPVLQPKRVLYIWPAWSLFIAQVIRTAIEQGKPTFFTITRKIGNVPLTAGILLGTLIAGLQVFSTISYWTQPLLQRENWRSLISEIELFTPPNKTVAVFSFPAPFAPWEWYANQEIDTLSSGHLSIDRISSIRDWIEPINEYDYVITFEYLQDLSDPQAKVEGEVSSYQYQAIQLYDYPLIGFTKVWSKPGSRLTQESGK